MINTVSCAPQQEAVNTAGTIAGIRTAIQARLFTKAEHALGDPVPMPRKFFSAVELLRDEEV